YGAVFYPKSNILRGLANLIYNSMLSDDPRIALDAAKYRLNTKGRHCGYGEKLDIKTEEAGNRALRRMMVEMAWTWLRWEPDSALSRWYTRRFAYHGERARKVGIVAVARKLLIALWRYLEEGEFPAGARLVSWRAKVSAKASTRAAADKVAAA